MKKVIFIPTDQVIQTMNKKQLQAFFGISNYLITQWLKECKEALGNPKSRIYSVKQVQMLIDRYGMPGKYVEQDEAA